MNIFKPGTLVKLKGIWYSSLEGIGVDPGGERMFIVTENLTHNFPGRDPLHSCRVLTNSGEIAEFLEGDLEAVE